MVNIITQLFGAYTPLTDSNGLIISGVSGINFTWLSGVLLFALTLYCVFRIIGGIFK